MDALFESERDIVIRNTTEIEVLNETIILREQFLRRSRKLEQDIINNKEVDPDAKVKAHHLAAELDKAAHTIYYEAPSALASRRARLSSSSTVPALPSSLEEAFRLEFEKAMKKKKQQEEEEEYDELDISEEEEAELEELQKQGEEKPENSYGFN